LTDTGNANAVVLDFGLPISKDVSLGNVVSIAANLTPTLTDSGNANAVVLDFGLPISKDVSLGNVTILAANATPTLTDSGNANAVVLDFGLPQAANVSLGNTTVLPANGTPAVIDSGANGNVVLSFSLPQSANVSVGNVTTLPPESNVVVTNTGSAGNVILNFSIPQGQTGASTNLFDYTANTAGNSGDPGTGKVFWSNTANQINSTSIIVSHQTSLGTDIEVFLAALQATQPILIQDQAENNNFQRFEVTGNPTVTNGNTASAYVTIPVSYTSSSGTGTTGFANALPIFVAVIAGTQGPQGNAATITLGNVTTLSANASPTVDTVVMPLQHIQLWLTQRLM